MATGRYRCVHLGRGMLGTWSGRDSGEDWNEAPDPFAFLPRDRGHYPEETPRVLDWIKRRGRGSFRREEAAAVARRCGLIDRQHKDYSRTMQTGQGTMYEALEILEVYDYLRSFITRPRGAHHFIVNPGVLLRPALAPTPPPSAPMRRAFSHEQKRELWFAAGGRCCICRIRLGPDWHADHVDPWSNGGPTVVANGMALCPECNLRKSARVLTVEGGQG